MVYLNLFQLSQRSQRSQRSHAGLNNRENLVYTRRHINFIECFSPNSQSILNQF